MDVNSPVYLQHASLCAFHRALGDYITHRPSDSPKLKTVQYQHHATDITGVRLVFSNYFQDSVEQGRNSSLRLTPPNNLAYSMQTTTPSIRDIARYVDLQTSSQ